MLKQKLKIIIRKILFRRMPVIDLDNHTEEELFLIEELRKEAEKIVFNDRKKMTSSELMWNNNIKQLKHLILNKDPRKFLTWSVVKRTMFVETPLYIISEYKYLKRKKDFKEKWVKYIKETDIGAPNKYFSLGGSSGNLIHHNYHLAIFQDKTGKCVTNSDLILEFGGGYGSMCRLVHQMMFKKKYIIFDLPIFSALQKYYLKSLKLPVLNTEEFINSREGGILCLSSFDELQSVLNKTNSKHINSAFIATWSLSETPLNIRDRMIKLINDFNYFLIAYQLNFGEVDNTLYFKDFVSKNNEVNWLDWNIDHTNGSRYLMGTSSI